MISTRLFFPLALFAALPLEGAVPPAEVPAKHRGLLENHCLSCHGPEKQKGKFRVDDLSY
jgi:mono/diheme cytochrome c family protein